MAMASEFVNMEVAVSLLMLSWIFSVAQMNRAKEYYGYYMYFLM